MPSPTPAKRKRSTSGFHQYTCPQHTHEERLRISRSISIMGGIVGMLEMAQDKIRQAISFLRRKQTKEHLKNSQVIPKPLVMMFYRIRQKMDSALVCYRDGLSGSEKDPDILDLLETLYNLSTSIPVDTMDSEDIPGTVEQLTTLGTKIEGVRIKLLPNLETPLVTEVPQKPFTVNLALPTPTRIPYSHKELSPFFEKAKSRGWKVPQREQRQPLFDLDDDDDDGFGMSYHLITSVSKPAESLLPDKQTIGLTTFPVVSMVGRQLPESFVQTCTAPMIGYSMYRVFGNYLVVDNMYLFGIHRSLMWIKDEKGKKDPVVDLDKFSQLLPQLIEENPKQAELLERMHPIQPAKQKGYHFYTPLLPTEVLQNWSHGIGDWEFLDK